MACGVVFTSLNAVYIYEFFWGLPGIVFQLSSVVTFFLLCLCVDQLNNTGVTTDICHLAAMPTSSLRHLSSFQNSTENQIPQKRDHGCPHEVIHGTYHRVFD